MTTDRAKLYENAVLERREIDKYNREIVDVSKDLKIELQQKLEQIKLYSQVVESNQDAIITSDDKGNLLTGNQAFLSLFGYVKDELKTLSTVQLFEDLDFNDPDYRKLTTDGWKGQKKAFRKNGAIFPAMMSVSPVITKTEKAEKKTVFAIVVRNISLQKKYEQNILNANEELKQTYKELENTLSQLEKSNHVKRPFPVKYFITAQNTSG